MGHTGQSARREGVHARAADGDAAAIARRLEALGVRGIKGVGESTDVGSRVRGMTGLEEVLGVGSGRRGGCGMVHEWIGVAEREEAGSDGGERTRRPAGRMWSSPLAVLIEMARRAGGRLVWVGEMVWPYPAALVNACAGAVRGERRVRLERCLFVRAARPAERVWAADLALRSGAAAAVIADGSGFDLAATRRLQLAAEASGVPCVLARPVWERRELSAAGARWLVRRAPSKEGKRRWTVELLRCKGVRPADHAKAWFLEHDHAAGAVRVAADAGDRPGQAAPVGAGWPVASVIPRAG